jgi:hypothetical protein
MLDRRTALIGIGMSAIALGEPILARAQSANGSFTQLFDDAIKKPDILEATRQVREGLVIEFDLYETKAIAPRYKPSGRKISDDAVNLIIAFEVTNQSRYERLYQLPVWPRGRSGVTIGIGYDVGYSTPEWLREDWGGLLSERDLSTLQEACTITGPRAADIIPRLTAIRIPWVDAYKQFTTTSLPRFTAETIAALPNNSKLSEDSLGALVSLVYNRGPSFKLVGDRYREMRAIHLDMVNEEYDRIPDEIRNMQRLWKDDSDTAGLVTRRILEAALFEKGRA